jgi:DNA processing protein
MGWTPAATGPQVVRPDDPRWPPLWREMSDAPTSVTVTGNVEVLPGAGLAIVGTRRPTARGLAVAETLAYALAASGWMIVSGLARGIDGAAHRGALRAGGATIAVMGTGWDLTYPPLHRPLRRQLEESGCCLTELPAGAPPLRHHFPERNRLIAGLAEGVIVVEAPERSGALVTARLALELGREVFAVPGPVDCPQSRGCHRLLRQGATLVEGPADVLAVLAPPASVLDEAAAGSAAASPLTLPPPGTAARWIWERLDLEGVSGQDLRRRWRGEAAALDDGLLRLEVAGLVRRLPGGRLARSIWLHDA